MAIFGQGAPATPWSYMVVIVWGAAWVAARAGRR